MGVHCDHTVHISADLSLWLDRPMFWTAWHESISIIICGSWASCSFVVLCYYFLTFCVTTCCIFMFMHVRLICALIKFTYLLTYLLPAVFHFQLEVRWGMDVQTRRDISRTVEDTRLSYQWVLIGSHICRVDWHNNVWPWVTLNGRFIGIARYVCGKWASCFVSAHVS